ncbi:unnamed protein product [Coregonus sp. 'balchen']|nr:unnamed protein product [Coregonus sp. 'balchen']
MVPSVCGVSLAVVVVLVTLVSPGGACPRPCSCYQPTELHCTFRRLELLMLHGNDICEIPDEVFQDLSSLQVLKLSYNKLREISAESFSGLSSLLRLHLDHNRLQFLHPQALLCLPNLRLIRLQGNRLHQLHPQAFCTLSLLQTFCYSTLRHLDVSNNRVLKCPGPQCPVCASPKHMKGCGLLQQKDLSCTPPVISTNPRASSQEDGEVQPIETFREALGDASLGMSDQQGNAVDLKCNITHSSQTPDITSPHLSSSSIPLSLSLSLSLSLDCGVDVHSYERLWRLLAYYSETPVRLQREIMLSKAPRLAYRYRQTAEKEGYYHTGVKANLQAQPAWLLQPHVSLELNRAQSSAHRVKLTLSTLVSAPPDPPSPHSWVLIQTNHTHTAFTAAADSQIHLPCPVLSSIADLSSRDPRLQWVFPDGSTVSSPYRSSDGRIRVSGQGLVLQRVDHSDAGLYYCVARAGGDVDVLPLRLAVVESSNPPPGEELGPAVTGLVGDPVSLPCEASGTPRVEVNWVLPGGRVVGSRNKGRRKGAAGVNVLANGTLSLPLPALGDAGLYRCVAVNLHGVDSLSTRLTLIPHPSDTSSRMRYPMRPQSALGVSNRVPAPLSEEVEEGGSGDDEGEEENMLPTRAGYNRTRRPPIRSHTVRMEGSRPPQKGKRPLRRGFPVEQRRNRLEGRRSFNLAKHKIDPQKWADLLAKIRERTAPKDSLYVPPPTRSHTITSAPTEAQTTTPTEAQTTTSTPTEAQTTTSSPTEAQTTTSSPTEAQTTTSTPTRAQSTRIQTDSRHKESNDTTRTQTTRTNPGSTQPESTQTTRRKPGSTQPGSTQPDRIQTERIQTTKTQTTRIQPDTTLPNSTPEVTVGRNSDQRPVLDSEADSSKSSSIDVPSLQEEGLNAVHTSLFPDLLTKDRVAPETPNTADPSNNFPQTPQSNTETETGTETETESSPKSTKPTYNVNDISTEERRQSVTPVRTTGEGERTGTPNSGKVIFSNSDPSRPRSPWNASNRPGQRRRINRPRGRPTPRQSTPANTAARLPDRSQTTITHTGKHTPTVTHSHTEKQSYAETEGQVGATPKEQDPSVFNQHNPEDVKATSPRSGTTPGGTTPTGTEKEPSEIESSEIEPLYPETEEELSEIEPPATDEEEPSEIEPPATDEEDPSEIEPPATDEEEPSEIEPPASEEEPSEIEPPATDEEEQSEIEPPATDEEPSGIEPPATDEEPSGIEPPATDEDPSEIEPLYPTTDEEPSVIEGVKATPPQSRTTTPGRTTPTGTEKEPSEIEPVYPATEEEPSEIEPPAMDEEPSEIEPLATDEEPSAIEPLATDEEPNEIEPPATDEEEPSEIEPLATDEEEPSEIEPPATDEEPSEIEPPASDEEPNEIEPAATEEEPSEIEPSASDEEPSEIEPLYPITEEEPIRTPLQTPPPIKHAPSLPHPVKPKLLLPDVLETPSSAVPTNRAPSSPPKASPPTTGTQAGLNPASTPPHSLPASPDRSMTAQRPPQTSVLRVRPRIAPPHMRPMSVPAEIDALLPCEAIGQPPPTITWTKVSTGAVMSLDSKAERFQVLPNGTFLIRSVQVQDRGTYICSAQNSVGLDRAMVTLEVWSRPPHIQLPNHRDATVHQGGEVRLECRAQGVPVPLLSWVLPDRSVLTPDPNPNPALGPHSRVSIFPNGTLRILVAGPADRGLYRCVASNPSGAGSLSVRLHVSSLPPAIQQPREERITRPAGMPLYAQCSARGAPAPSIRWRTPDGTLLLPSQFLNGNLFVLPNATLLIRKLATKDSGSYECLATNAVGGDKRTVRVEVTGDGGVGGGEIGSTDKMTFSSINSNFELPPSSPVLNPPLPPSSPLSKARILSTSPSSSIVIYGESLLLHCSATGNPEPRVSVTEKDGGGYLCVARNKMADDYRILQVTVVTKPAKIKPKQPSNQKVVSYGAALKVDCLATGQPDPAVRWSLPNGTSVKSVLLQVEERRGRSRRLVVFDNGTLFLPSVEMGQEGEYVCHAENHGGRDTMRVMVKVLTSPPSFPSTKYEVIKVQQGGQVALNCGAKGQPVPTITWLSPMNRVLPVEGSGPVGVRQDGSLVIQGARGADGGNYTCRASNAAGERSKVMGVEVMVTPPSFTLNGAGGGINGADRQTAVVSGSGLSAVISISQSAGRDHRVSAGNCVNNNGDRNVGDQRVSAVRGQTVLLPCPSQGFPPPRLAWLLPGNGVLPVPYYGSRLTVHRNGTLELRGVRASDAGMLVCVNRSERGEARIMVHLEVSDTKDTPHSRGSVTTEKPCPVGPVSTEQLRTGGPDTEETPSPRGPVTTEKSRQETPRPTGPVTTEKPRPRGPVPEAGRSVVLERKPVVTNISGSLVSIINGENLQLPCPQTDSPSQGSSQTQSLTWKLPSGVVVSRGQTAGTGRYSVLDDGTLTVQKVSVFDRGTYSCQSTNQDTSSILTVPVIVIAYPPRITNGPPPLTYTRPGVAVQLTCYVIATPRATITWEMPDQSQLRVTGQARLYGNRYLSPQGSLVIQNPTSRDTGFYRCSAWNVIGADTKATYLHVI